MDIGPTSKRKNNITLSISVIQGMAMSLYDYWMKHLGESAATAPEFHANKG
jgi:hypothetical protein